MKAIFALCLLLCLSATFAQKMDLIAYKYYNNRCFKLCQAKVCGAKTMDEAASKLACRYNTQKDLDCLNSKCQKLNSEECFAECKNPSDDEMNLHECFYGCNFVAEYPIKPKNSRFLAESI